MSTVAFESMGEIPLELKADLDPDFVDEFITDAREQLENIEQGALALEKDPQAGEVLHTLFRAFHTLKGNAGFLDLSAVGQLAHLLESMLEEAREGRLKINSAIIEIILDGRDTLQQFVNEIEAQHTGAKPRQIVHIRTTALKAKVKAVLDGGETSSVASLPAKIEEPAEDEHASFETSLLPNDVFGQAVKVSTLKLDGLVDLTGELLIAQSLVLQSVSSANVSRQTITANLDQLNRISKELQRTAMSMRMVPIRATLQKLHRLVRDIATAQNKEVQLILEGEDTEVDRTIAEKMADPLMHMVRNAVDHAIESPAQRIATGKPVMGTIHLRAYHKSGNIVIEVEDDGKGMDRERIRKQAIKIGALAPSTTPSDRDLLHMILQPGFTTADVVTDISGRGVGMDVVQKNISKLRGKIEIQSVVGLGTIFTLRMPLTLAIIDGLIIGVDGQRYILPTHAVRESFDARACAITPLADGNELVQVRKELIPLLRLREHFHLKESFEPGGKGIVIVIESDGKKRCLLADELVGKQEVVVKNLGEVFKTDPMVSGGAILSDGCVGLILDAGALVHLESNAHELSL
jgi:two-component system, chemotaxis family, sensor kinase CheA